MDKLGGFEVASVAFDALVGELHDAFCEGEKSVIFTFGDIDTSADFGAALANEDITDFGGFTGKLLDTKALTMRITAVTGRTTCFFVGHSYGARVVSPRS